MPRFVYRYHFPLCLLHALFLLILLVLPFASTSHLETDHNHHRIDVLSESLEPLTPLGDQYEAEFVGFERSLIGRAASDVTELHNDQYTSATISAGQTQNYVFMNSSVFGPPSPPGAGLPPDWSPSSNVIKRSLNDDDIVAQKELKKRDEDQVLEKRQAAASQIVYISASTCTQPAPGSPQLTLFVSTSSGNSKPGPGGPSDQQMVIPFNQGFAQLSVAVTDNVYIGIAAPSGTGSWSYQVSASVSSFYLNSGNVTYGYVLDTDSKSALVSTLNLTDSTDPVILSQWTGISKPPFSLFLFNSSNTLDGLRNSYCGVSKAAAASLNITTQITTRNNGSPKQQFYVQGLTPGQSYNAFIGYQAPGQDNTTAASFSGAGGTIWGQMIFETKSDGNCQIVFGLPFCSNVAYAVPSNSTSTMNDLISFYDSTAQSYFQNFSLSLQQVPCNTTSSAQYSLARTCTDCSRDYQTWLCAVTIPRCTDFSAPASPGLIARNIVQNTINGTAPKLDDQNLPVNASALPWFSASRNKAIDTFIKPGPYKEFLPCINLCYEIVKSCPASMGFACPRQESLQNKSYGVWDKSVPWPGTCSYLGQDAVLNASARVQPGGVFLVAILLLWTWLVWL